MTDKMEGGTKGSWMLEEQVGTRQCPSCKVERGGWKGKTAGRARRENHCAGCRRAQAGQVLRCKSPPDHPPSQCPLHPHTSLVSRPVQGCPPCSLSPWSISTSSRTLPGCRPQRILLLAPGYPALLRQSSPPLFLGGISRFSMSCLGHLLVSLGKFFGP